MGARQRPQDINMEIIHKVAICIRKHHEQEKGSISGNKLIQKN